LVQSEDQAELSPLWGHSEDQAERVSSHLLNFHIIILRGSSSYGCFLMPFCSSIFPRHHSVLVTFLVVVHLPKNVYLAFFFGRSSPRPRQHTGYHHTPCCFLADFVPRISKDDSVSSTACLPHEHDETTHPNELGWHLSAVFSCIS
jgi:hypothetical protein